MNINLFEETVKVPKEHEKTPDDVLWVGCSIIDSDHRWDEGYVPAKVRCDWKDFEESANRSYDNGYGGAEVDETLIVVGKDFWLERYEYDGAEWWEYKTFPQITEYEEGNVEPFYDGV